jgi:hypothetical protein
MVAGLMSIKLSWIQKGSLTCIKMGLMGEHCVQFVPVAGGYEGSEQGNDRQMTLRRN